MKRKGPVAEPPQINERSVEIPWILEHVPRFGTVLDIGSCEATYLADLQRLGLTVHAMDPRGCEDSIPPGVVFHRTSIIGNDLPRGSFDTVLLVSTLEHIGLPYYDQPAFAGGDRLTLAEVRELLRPEGLLLASVPAGQSKVASWYRQYSPADLEELFRHWTCEIEYRALVGTAYKPIPEQDVVRYDYRDRHDLAMGAGAVALIRAAVKS